MTIYIYRQASILQPNGNTLDDANVSESTNDVTVDSSMIISMNSDLHDRGNINMYNCHFILKLFKLP